MLHGRISLNAVLPLLLVNFVSGFRLELLYISLIESTRSSLSHLHGFLLLDCFAATIVQNRLFQLHQQNKSSESKVKFKRVVKSLQKCS